eukprot:scaffold105504_cov20-Prasinocladus_malaysianus.AAC.1
MHAKRAVVLSRAPALEGLESVVVEVCGGAIATPAMLEAWKSHCPNEFLLMIFELMDGAHQPSQG